jgi:phosphoribosylaminoimidazole-succinocarboxamide synthase/formyltetrahydrofolate-dependent phosphoribosylglycinamide formyltransferase
MNFNCAIFCSGAGSNLQAIYTSITNNILIANISIVIIDNNNAKCIDYCKLFNINYKVIVWDKANQTRENYYNFILDNVMSYNLNLIVCAGWMNIIPQNFIDVYKNIINLHPALPNTFIGSNCIKKAYDSYLINNIKYSGIMVHRVIADVDMGPVLKTIKVPFNNTDDFNSFETRMKIYEKGLLISTIQDFIIEHNNLLVQSKEKIYNGKVRCVEDIGCNRLLLTASNRISAFNKHLTNIPNKGVILNKLSEFWFNNTGHIIKNHFLYSNGPYMIVQKTKPIKLEIVVRGYMTGSSETSIWTKYNNGETNIYGYNFRDGYNKNEILDSIVITPTTKGIVDEPLTKEEIIDKYLTKEETEFIYNKALELFKFGQSFASDNNLILVDTKYEFGKLENGEIILIDELHTCDSSRYWIKDTYLDRFNNNLEPVKLDKDSIRDWVKSNCDPYKDHIPVIPNEIVEKVENVYINFYERLTRLNYTKEHIIDKANILTDYFDNYHKDIVIILGGSVSDNDHLNNIKNKLSELNIYSVIHVCSAHKNTSKLLGILNSYENFNNRNIIYVTCAGMSNALSGVVACNSRYPVFACPPFKDTVDMQININSTLQMPSKVPTMTILNAGNLALAIQRIININV